jgi:hypothetical protein
MHVDFETPPAGHGRPSRTIDAVNARIAGWTVKQDVENSRYFRIFEW